MSLVLAEQVVAIQAATTREAVGRNRHPAGVEGATMIRKGDTVSIRPEWRDPGDEKYAFVALEDESPHSDCIRIGCVNVWPDSPFVPNQIVRLHMLERPCAS